MKIKNLYKFERPDGGTTVSTEKPDVPHGIMYRIIASAGKLVTKNGIDTYSVIDTDSSEGWYEIDDLSEQEVLE